MNIEEADAVDADAPSGRTEGDDTGASGRRGTLLYSLRVVVYSLGALVALALLTAGTVAVIAEVKGTWHWQIHLETTVAYTAVFVVYLLAALVPSTALLVLARWRWSA